MSRGAAGRAPRRRRATAWSLTRSGGARQPPPFEFFSQHETQVAPQAAHLPPPPPLGGRACGDASRTPPHYSMETFMPHGCALDMSPGETGGSQYIASPLVPSQPRAGGDAALALHAGNGSQGDAAPGSQGAPERMPLYPIFMVRACAWSLRQRRGSTQPYRALLLCAAPAAVARSRCSR